MALCLRQLEVRALFRKNFESVLDTVESRAWSKQATRTTKIAFAQSLSSYRHWQFARAGNDNDQKRLYFAIEKAKDDKKKKK